MKKYFCIECELLKFERPCEKCGSNNWYVEVNLLESVSIHNIIAGKMKENGIGKPFLEFKSGDDFFGKT